MTLITSGRATGRRCPICGSPDGACGGAHATTEPTPVDSPVYAKGTRTMPVDVVARRVINGYTTEVLANSEQAEREGWPIVRRLDGKPYHKKRPKPEAPAPTEPETVEPETEADDEPEPEDTARADYLAGLTKPELYDIAKDLDVEGRSTLDRGELITAILEAEAAE